MNYQASYILKNMLNETNYFAAAGRKKSAVFPFPVSGENPIDIYDVLHTQAKEQRIFFPQTMKFDCNGYYRIRRESENSSENPNWYMGKIELFEEPLVDFYYGCAMKDICQRYLVIQNPASKNTYIQLIFIPKGMEQEFCNYYRYIYCNLPYSPHNTVIISSLPHCQGNKFQSERGAANA